MFDFFPRIAALPDGRCYAKHTAQKILEAVFFGSACQFGPLHRIETECRQGALRRRIGRVSEDAIGYTLERQDPNAIFALGCDVARQLSSRTSSGAYEKHQICCESEPWRWSLP